MKIAVHTPFEPAAPIAEAEVFARMSIAVARLGWSCLRTRSTSEIEAFAPDLVLVEHFFLPKLTSFPTLGLLWNPPAYWQENDDHLKNIISYDGHLFADDNTRLHVADLAAPLSTRLVAGTWLPTCYETTLSAAPRAGLAYFATRWDPDRHSDLIPAVARRCGLNGNGAGGESGSSQSPAAPIPFDGRAVVAELGRRTAALCLHSVRHRQNGTPSARVFEAAAAGAIIISDENPFVRRAFGDCALYVDVDSSTDAIADAIARHLAWIDDHPEAAERMRSEAHRIFVERFSFELLLRQLPGHHDEIYAAWRPPAPCADQSVAMIVRTGERDVAMLDRALTSLEAQTHKNIHAIVVAYRNADAVRSWLTSRRTELRSATVVESSDSGLRSTALWAGLRHVRSDFFGLLDDDDTLTPDHIASCLVTLAAHPRMDLAYGGSITVDETVGDRSVYSYRRFDLDEFRRGNHITSHCWLARNALLARIGRDPSLAAWEDYCLLLRFAEGGSFVPTWRMTAEYRHRRDDQTASAALGDPTLETSRVRAARLSYFAAVSHERPTAPVEAPPPPPASVAFPIMAEVMAESDQQLAAILRRLLDRHHFWLGVAFHIRSVASLPLRLWRRRRSIPTMSLRELRRAIVARGKERDLARHPVAPDKPR